MKYVYLILFAFGLFVVNQSSSLAQGACPGPNCRSASAAAAGAAAAAKLAEEKRAATKAADEQKKAQQAAAKAAEAVKSNAPNMSTPGSKNMSQQPVLDTVNNVQLQNSTPNRRPEIEDIKSAHGQGRKDIIAARKKWDKDHPAPQEEPSAVSKIKNFVNGGPPNKIEPDPEPGQKSKLFIKTKTVATGHRG